MKSYKEYLNKVHKYAKWYNNIAKKDTPLTAISMFVQNKIQVVKQAEKLVNNFENEKLLWMRNFISVKDNDNYEIKKASQTVVDSINKTFPYSLVLPFFDVDKQTLRQELKDFWKLTGRERFAWIDKDSGNQYLEVLYQELNDAYKEKEKIENLLYQEIAFGYIIEKALINKYPSDVTKYINDEDAKDQVKENPMVKQGRKYDVDAPKNKLEDYIIEIIEKGKNKEKGFKKFWHHKNPNKGTPNKNQIINHLLNLREDVVKKAEGIKEKDKARKESLIGELKRSGVKKRVYKAVKEHGH